MKIILLSILSFLIIENNSSFEIEIIYGNNNQSYLWKIERITNDNGEEINHPNSLENHKIKINKSGIYTIIFKSKFGESTKKQIEILPTKRRVKVKIPNNFYQEVKPKEILNKLNSSDKFSIYKLHLGCWGEAEKIWKFDNQNNQIEISENKEVKKTKFPIEEYEQIVKQIAKLKKDKKSFTFRDFFTIKINNEIAFIDGSKNVWTGYYQINQKLVKK
jgi:hypothetical protein